MCCGSTSAASTTAGTCTGAAGFGPTQPRASSAAFVVIFLGAAGGTRAAGVSRENIIVDPGIGFGKTNAQSLRLVRELERLKELGCPILLGVSRKRLIGRATGRAIARERLAGSLAAAVIGATKGADILRVHDVAEHVDAMKVHAAIMNREDAETD